MVNEFFKGLDIFQKEQYHIEMKSDVMPVVNLYHFTVKLREALNKLESRGIIKKVNNATYWPNNLDVIGKKLMIV